MTLAPLLLAALTLVFSDEFDGARLDDAKWTDWVSSFQGRSAGFLFARDNVAVSNGCLNLTARFLRNDEKTPENLRRGFSTYATAYVRAKEKTYYGYYECRAKTMRSKVCNAFWLYDPLSDQPKRKFRPGDFSEEIDMFEIFGLPRDWYGTVHCLRTPYLEGIVSSGVEKLPEKSKKIPLDFDPAADFHVYGFRWTSKKLTWLIDGKEVFSRPNDRFHRPLHVTFDCEVMYNWVGEPAAEELPAVYSVDYFRYYRIDGEPTVHVPRAKPILAINEDNDHYFKNPSNYMDKAHLEEYIDRIAAGRKVTHLFLCPTGGRASFDSKTWEPIWRGLEEYPEKDIWFLFRDWSKNAKMLYDKGIDPYQVWIRRCREKGISPWLAPRMNDCHDGAANLRMPYRSISLWRERKDLHIDPTCNKPCWGPHSFDYAHAEVRESALKMLEELFERYDADGIELDGGLLFRREEAEKNAPLADDFMRKVHEMALAWGAKRGHKILIACQFGCDPDDCRARGNDIARWVREGLADWVICRNGGSDPKYKIPVEKWRKAFGDRKDAVVLCGVRQTYYPSSDRKDPGANFFGEMYRGWADVQWCREPDGLYLFNMQYQPRTFHEVCDFGLSPDEIRRHARCYPVLKGLPQTLGKPVAFSVPVGTALEGEQTVLIGFRASAPENLRVTLNGVESFRDEADYVSHAFFNENQKLREFSLPFTYHARRFYFPKGGAKTGDNKICVEGGVATDEILSVELLIGPRLSQ